MKCPICDQDLSIEVTHLGDERAQNHMNIHERNSYKDALRKYMCIYLFHTSMKMVDTYALVETFLDCVSYMKGYIPSIDSLILIWNESSNVEDFKTRLLKGETL